MLNISSFYWVGAIGLATLAYVVLRKPRARTDAPIPVVQLGKSRNIENEAHFDVVIVGAGISGISAAYELIKKAPNKSYVILEHRADVGGTWDLFRYPGIRSDSDMYTLGFSYKPWVQSNPIAPGADIRNYVKLVTKENAIDANIAFHKHLVEANFSSQSKSWNLLVEDSSTGERRSLRFSCDVLHMCTGYYDYNNPYQPQFEEQERFKGPIIHPQLWDENFDYHGKKIVIIGSGATAVTLLPSMAEVADHVVMLQRSPTYILSMPSKNKFSETLYRLLPFSVAYRIIRWEHVFLAWIMFVVCKSCPDFTARLLLNQAKSLLPSGFDVEKHFKPYYKPWDQRLCLAPDADIFKAIRSGKASIVTDHIERFLENGILLKSGQVLEADVIVTATGLCLQLFGGAKISLDNQPIEFSKKFVYRGMMFDNVPNFIYSVGYTNASWTLKCELTSCWAARILKYMEKTGAKTVTPYLAANHNMTPKPLLNLNSGYLQRGMHLLPQVGNVAPWTYNNYPGDLLFYFFGRLNDGVLKFE